MKEHLRRRRQRPKTAEFQKSKKKIFTSQSSENLLLSQDGSTSNEESVHECVFQVLDNRELERDASLISNWRPLNFEKLSLLAFNERQEDVVRSSIASCRNKMKDACWNKLSEELEDKSMSQITGSEKIQSSHFKRNEKRNQIPQIWTELKVNKPHNSIGESNHEKRESLIGKDDLRYSNTSEYRNEFNEINEMYQTFKETCDQEIGGKQSTLGFRPYPDRNIETRIADLIERKQLNFQKNLREKSIHHDHDKKEVSKLQVKTNNVPNHSKCNKDSWKLSAHTMSKQVHIDESKNIESIATANGIVFKDHDPEAKLRNKDKQIDSLKHKLWFAEHLFGRLKSEMYQIKEESIKWKQNFREESRHRVENKQLEESLRKCKSELENERKRFQFASTEVSDLKEENRKLRKNLATVKIKLSEYAQREERTKLHMQGENQMFSERISDLSEKNESFRLNGEILEEKLLKVKNKWKTVVFENKKLKKEIEELDEKLGPRSKRRNQ